MATAKTRADKFTPKELAQRGAEVAGWKACEAYWRGMVDIPEGLENHADLCAEEVEFWSNVTPAEFRKAFAAWHSDEETTHGNGHTHAG